MDYLIKFDAFVCWTEFKLWTFRHGSKSIQMSLICWQFLDSVPQNHINSPFYFTISVIFMKAGKHSDIPLSYFQIVGEWPDLTVVTKLQNVFRVCMVFGGRCQEVRNICNGFWSKVHSSTTVQRKSIRLDQMIHLNLIFHMVVSNYRLVKSWNSPHFLAQARNWPIAESDLLRFSICSSKLSCRHVI